jgi:hypothetical protein
VAITAGQGQDTLTFTIPKNLICHYSPFFEAASNSSMVEGQTQSMKLDDIEKSTFGLFVNWLYTQKIENVDGDEMTMLKVLQLWNLGQRFLIPQLQNSAMFLLMPRDARKAAMPFYKLAFDAVETTPIQRLIIKVFVAISYNKFRSGEKDGASNLMGICVKVGEKLMRDFTRALMEQSFLGVQPKSPGVADLKDYLVLEEE